MRYLLRSLSQKAMRLLPLPRFLLLPIFQTKPCFRTIQARKLCLSLNPSLFPPRGFLLT